MWGKNGAISKKGILFEVGKKRVTRLFRIYRNPMYFLDWAWKVLTKKKWGGNRILLEGRKSSFYSKMWGNAPLEC